MKDIVILYHGECPDGFASAWVAHKKFGDNAEYIPARHNRPVPDGIENKEVYMIDFTYPEDIMRELIMKNKRVTAIDHHVSREKEIKMTQDHRYSIDDSGSVMAWKYFYPDKEVPKLVQYIGDRDLWRFELENTDEICAFIDSLDYSFDSWDKLSADLEDSLRIKEYIEKGGIMLNHEKRMMERLISESSRRVLFEGYEAYAINAPHFFASYLGSMLVKKKPPISIIWSEDKERVKVSLRSDGSVDVSKLAQKFGGGGHKAAAGFSISSINLFPWKNI